MAASPLDKRLKLVKRLKRIAARNPALGLRLAAVLAALPRWSSHWAPSAGEVVALFGALPPGRVGAIRRRVASLALRNQVLVGLSNKRGLQASLPLIRIRGEEEILALRREGVPVVAIYAHMGAAAISAGLAKLGLAASFAAVAKRQRHEGEGVDFYEVTSVTSGAGFLRQALRDLQAGRVVGVSVDTHRDEAGRKVRFLGGQLTAAAGPALLARLAGARLVPVTARWLGASPRIEVTVHPPLPVPPEADFEAVLTASAVRFFEEYLRAHPEEVRKWYLKSLQAGPAAPRCG